MTDLRSLYALAAVMHVENGGKERALKLRARRPCEAGR